MNFMDVRLDEWYDWRRMQWGSFFMFGLAMATWAWVGGARGSSLDTLDDDGLWREAEAVCIGRMVSSRSEKAADGIVRTRVVVAVQEALKGRFGPRVSVTLRGGQVGNDGEHSGDVPVLRAGEERVWFLRSSALGLTLSRAGDACRPTEKSARGSRLLASRAVARWRELRRQQPSAGRDVRSWSIASSDAGAQSGMSGGGGGTEGLWLDGAGIPARWLAADRGVPIPYVVDAQALPLGISLAEALAAVEDALAAWSAVTSLTFVFAGMQEFGQSAATITTNDERIRIQLHDLYGQLSSGTVLGLGGRGFTNGDSIFAATGGAGGQVDGVNFHRVTRGYVVLQHSSPTMRTLSTFAEVLCHELGHVLGMAHSSEAPAEADPLLNQAIMYYRAHADGRGATLGAYDPPIVQKAHPPTNTPPFSFPRALNLITAPVTPNLPGVNEVRLLGCDGQSPDATLTIIDGPSSTGTPNTLGSWSRTGTLVKFTPNAYYGDQGLDPAGTSFYARAFYRFSDGVHASPWISVRVLGFQTDTFPADGGDGMPNEWMLSYFGSANPASGPRRGPLDDFDFDGWTNLEEFRNGTDPTDPTSGLHLAFDAQGNFQWPATPYEVYVVESSENASQWSRFRLPVMPTTTTGTLPGVGPAAASRQLFRLRRQE